MKESSTEIVTVPADEKGTIEVVPFGTDERIRLSVAIVQKMIAVPTRTGKIPDTTACIKFMMLCRARHLNPFEGDAFMLGYDTQNGPQFSLITAHQVFLKRAEASKGFNGMESGVIVKVAPHLDVGSTGILEREGDLVYEDEKLLGGWAKVYRKDREKPFYRRLKLATFNTGRSRWEKDPAGMICKCAEADALRTAFPTHLGGLYIQEETPPIDVTPVIERAKVPKISAGNGVQTQTEKESDKPDSPAETNLQRGPSGRSGETTATQGEDQQHVAKPLHSPKKKPAKLVRKKSSPSIEAPTNESKLFDLLASAGYTPIQFLAVAQAQGWIEEGEAMSEEKIEQFIEPENWSQAVLPELAALPK
jgi:phage recombination protein Bet